MLYRARDVVYDTKSHRVGVVSETKQRKITVQFGADGPFESVWTTHYLPASREHVRSALGFCPKHPRAAIGKEHMFVFNAQEDRWRPLSQKED